MNCIDYLKGKFAGVDEDTILRLFEEAKRERARLRKKFGEIGDMEEKLLERLQGRVQDAELIALAHRRALILQYSTRLNAFNFVMQNFTGREEEGLSAMLVGSNRTLGGSRNSVDANQTALKGWYLGGVIADLKALGGDQFEMFRRGVLDADVARALWSIDNTNPDAAFKGPKEALEIAQVIHKWQEKARFDQNKAGAWIGKEEGYIVRQSHDRAKIHKAGYQTWRDAIEPKLDWERIAGQTDDGEHPSVLTAEGKENFLKNVYRNLAEGRSMRRGEESGPFAGGFTRARIGAKAAQASHERVLHFKTADDWFGYNKQFGTRNLREAVVSGLSRAAENTALMRQLGPSPSSNFEQLYIMVHEAMLNAGDMKGLDRLQNARRRLEAQLKEVDGSLRDHSSPTVAAIGRNVRAFQNVTKLGGAVLSSFTDAPVASSEIAYQGGSFLGALGRQILDLVTLRGRGTEEEQQILSSLGVFFDNMNADIIARISGDESAGAMTRLQSLFFKLNGLSWWTDSFRRSVGLMMAHNMALDKAKAWGALHADRRRVLHMYGLDEAEWELMRLGDLSAADGRDYLTPEVFDSVPDEAMWAYMEQKGVGITPARTADMREELAQKLRTFYRDRINFAVLEPDAKTRAIMHLGTSTGTVEGELIRTITQFKSFPTAFAQKVWGREIYGKEGGKSSAAGIAQLMLATTLFGYGSMVVKDLIRGKNPRDPSEKETWIAAMMQGGGLGIYGDFLFGNHTRYGGNLASNLAGPTFGGTISEIQGLWERVRDGDTVAQSALRFAINNVPGNNLWWARSAFDYLIGYELFEMINPGYFNRMKRRVERENKQTFFASPVNW